MKFEELIYTLNDNMVVEICDPVNASNITVRKVKDLTVKECQLFIGKSIDLISNPDNGTTIEGTDASIKIILSLL